MSDTPIYQPESYSPEDIQQILQLAIARKDTGEELTRQQLWEIAAELDIDSSSIQQAERDWLEKKAVDCQRQQFNLYRRQRFQQKLTKYAIVNTFLVSIDLLAGGALSWSLYILLFWGLGLVMNGWRAYQSKGEEYERAFQRWNFQNEVKQTFSNLWNRFKA